MPHQSASPELEIRIVHISFESKPHLTLRFKKMKFTVATLLFVSLILSSSFIKLSFAYSAAAPSPAPPSLCDSKCGERCAKAGLKDRCLKYCGICCEECKCVPSGTYGNKSECPCYRDKKNSKGNPKCP